MTDPLDEIKNRALVATGFMMDLPTIGTALITAEMQMQNIDLFVDKDTSLKTLRVLKSVLASHAVCLARLQEAQKELCELRLKDLTTTKEED